jgi:hypothetical protein
MHIIVALIAVSLLSGCSVVRNVVVFPVAGFVWALDQVDPRPPGTAVAPLSATLGRVDFYDATSTRVSYGTVRSDGSADVFNMDGTRRGTIEQRPGDGTRVMTSGKR